MVGARNASAGAVKLARDFALALAEAGWPPAPAGAWHRRAAHRGALAAGVGGGGTVGVIASGIDIAYPPEHRDLQEEIAAHGP